MKRTLLILTCWCLLPWGLLAETFNDKDSNLRLETFNDSQVRVTGIIDATAQYVQIPPSVRYGGNDYTVVEIAPFAFRGNTLLRYVYFSAGSAVTTLSEQAFSGCTALEVVTGADRVTAIHASAFSGCASLRTAIFPNVQQIGDFAFQGCSALSDVTIPESVTAVGRQAYAQCSNISRLRWESEQVADYAAADDSPFADAGCTLYQLTFGKRIPAWLFANMNFYYSSFTFGNVTIGEGAFSGSNLVELTFNGTNIGRQAFYTSYSLTRITLGEGTVIGEEAFALSPDLQYIICDTPTPPVVADDAFSLTSALLSFTANVSNAQRDAYAATEGWRDLLPSFRVNIQVEDDLPAQVSGANSYRIGTTATLTAQPAPFYEVADWVLPGHLDEPLGTEQELQLTINHDLKEKGYGRDEATVILRLQPVAYTLNVTFDEGIEGGLITPHSTNAFRYGDVLTLQAETYPGFAFEAWDDLSTDPERTITVDWQVLATHDEAGEWRPLESENDYQPGQEYALNVTAKFTVNDTYFRITMTPSAKAGEIQCWSDDKVLRQAPLFNIPSDKYAYFSPKAAEGFVFDHWEWPLTPDGTRYSMRIINENTSTHLLTIHLIYSYEDPLDPSSPMVLYFPTQLTAVFKAVTTLTAEVLPGSEAGTVVMTDENGKAHPNGQYTQDAQQEAHLQAVAAEGYTFDHWEYDKALDLFVEEDESTHGLTVYLAYSSDGTPYFPTHFKAVFKAPDAIIHPHTETTVADGVQKQLLRGRLYIIRPDGAVFDTVGRQVEARP